MKQLEKLNEMLKDETLTEKQKELINSQISILSDEKLNEKIGDVYLSAGFDIYWGDLELKTEAFMEMQDVRPAYDVKDIIENIKEDIIDEFYLKIKDGDLYIADSYYDFEEDGFTDIDYIIADYIEDTIGDIYDIDFEKLKENVLEKFENRDLSLITEEEQEEYIKTLTATEVMAVVKRLDVERTHSDIFYTIYTYEEAEDEEFSDDEDEEYFDDRSDEERYKELLSILEHPEIRA